MFQLEISFAPAFLAAPLDEEDPQRGAPAGGVYIEPALEGTFLFLRRGSLQQMPAEDVSYR